MSRALDAIRGKPAEVRLNVVTLPIDVVNDHCDDSMTCQCRKCSRERSRIGAKGSGSASPFKVAA
jgi:hypothetical protein